MSDIFAQHAQLLTALYSAAAVLLEAVTDPVAIEQAPLKHRSTALNAVASLIGQLNKSRPTPVLSPDTRIEWDFGDVYKRQAQMLIVYGLGIAIAM